MLPMSNMFRSEFFPNYLFPIHIAFKSVQEMMEFFVSRIPEIFISVMNDNEYITKNSDGGVLSN